MKIFSPKTVLKHKIIDPKVWPTFFVNVACFVGVANAQTPPVPPDAGRILQEQARPQLQPPKPSQGVQLDTPALSEVLPGGASVTLKSIRFSGNTRLSQDHLQAVVSDALGKALDLGGLKALANRVSEHYRAQGYPFAKAFVAVQPISEGALRIDVVEGQYGQVNALLGTATQPDAALQALAQRYMATLTPGTVIESAPLERLSLVLQDLPGFKVSPILRPGQEMGTGDLDFNMERTQRINGDIGIDNQGNRYTGRDRIKANLDINSPFSLGDQITLHSLLSEQGMWMGTLGYSLPAGASGLRTNISYAHTYYELGGSFASAGQTGTADVTSIGMTYPVLRSQFANVNLSANWQDKRLNDKKALANTSADKTSSTLPITVSFDVRDAWGGGGVTYGSLAWTSGKLKLDSELAASDVQAKTEGGFDKFNLDVARIQALNWGSNGNFTLFGKLSAQQAGKNLDSSEDFGLGGATGVRAYPSGEAFGDTGWLTQIELRYNAGAFAPYFFYDAGSITTNANPWTVTAAGNERKLAGVGAGLRYQRTNWSLDAALAWRTEGGLPQSDAQDQREKGPQAWVSLGWRF
jgi:hemolysin activation/secretion protein